MTSVPAGPPPKPAAVTLAGTHVRLEPLALAHLPALARAGLDPDLWTWMPERVSGEADLRRWVERALADAAAGRAVPFAIVALPAGEVAGSTRYLNLAPEHRRLEIGATWVAKRWQRSAINTEAKLLLLTHAFETLGVNRVEFKTDALNARSRAALLRIGAKEEGTLRAHMVTDTGRVRDSVSFSITASEWPAVEAALRERLLR